MQVRGNRCTSGTSTRKGAGSLDTAVSTAGNSAEAASRPVEPRLPSGERHIFFNLSSIFTERKKKEGRRDLKILHHVRHEILVEGLAQASGAKSSRARIDLSSSPKFRGAY